MFRVNVRPKLFQEWTNKPSPAPPTFVQEVDYHSFLFSQATLFPQFPWLIRALLVPMVHVKFS